MVPAKSRWADIITKIDDVVGKRAMLPANFSPQTRPRWKRRYVLNQPFILKYVCLAIVSSYNKKFLTFIRRLVIARTIMDKYARNSYHTYLSNSWNPGWDLLDNFIREDNTNNAFFRSAWCSVITKPFLKRKMYQRWFHARNCFHYSLQH